MVIELFLQAWWEKKWVIYKAEHKCKAAVLKHMADRLTHETQSM